MTRTTNIKTVVRGFLIFSLFAFIIMYAVFRSRNITEGVSLSVEGITNGQVFEEEVLRIRGNATRAQHLSVNGREILVNEESDFEELLVLSPGYNIITVRAEDRFRKSKQEIYEVYYKPLPLTT